MSNQAKKQKRERHEYLWDASESHGDSNAVKKRKKERPPGNHLPLPLSGNRRRGTFRRLVAYAAGVWPLLVVLEVCIVGSALLDLARPWIIGFQLFDLVVRKQDLSRLPFVILLLTGSFIGQQILDFGADVLQELSNQRLINRLRCDLYAHTIALPVRFFDCGRTGDLLSRVTGDVDTVENFLETLMQNIGSQFITLAGTLAAMFAVSATLTLFLLPTVIALACSVLFFRRPVKLFSRRVRNLIGDMASRAEEAIGGVRVVKAFCGESFELERFASKSGDLLQGRVRLKKLSAIYSSTVEFCVFTGTLIVVWFAPRWMVTGRALTIGGLVAFFSYTTKLYSPVKALSKMNLSMQKILAAADRVFDVMDMPPESVNDFSHCQQPPLSGMPGLAAPSISTPLRVSGDIRFENVSFGYDPENQVVRNFSLHVKPGELVALVGPSGGGKTTIVNLLLRFYEPTSGCILIDDVPLHRIPLHNLRQQIGVVSQETFLFSGTSRENIAYACPDVTDVEIIQAARAAHAHHFLSESPDGYLTEVGERGLQLSGGQRQRIAIARAILRNPRIMIFDEATAHLDSESEQMIQEALEKLAEGRTIVVVAHRFSTIRRADRIVVLENGKIVETGRHEELLAQNGPYRRVYSLQM
jgi:ABC-type multidrug transport system fused ATPase/permease subunit